MNPSSKPEPRHSLFALIAACLALAGIACCRSQPFLVTDLAVLAAILLATTTIVAREAEIAAARRGLSFPAHLSRSRALPQRDKAGPRRK